MNNKQKQLIRDKHIELILLYLKYRNIHNIGYQQYKIFKNLMLYITGLPDRSYIRNLFEILLARNIFQLKYIHKSRFYIFNPYNLEYNLINNKIEFN